MHRTQAKEPICRSPATMPEAILALPDRFAESMDTTSSMDTDPDAMRDPPGV
jgi:hypothetical protein